MVSCILTLKGSRKLIPGVQWMVRTFLIGKRNLPKCSPLAIIFLAPICAFDQTLVEDKSVNRLVRVRIDHTNLVHFSPIHLPIGRLCDPMESSMLQ